MTTFKCIQKDGTSRTIFVKDRHFGRPGATLTSSPPCFYSQAIKVEDDDEEEWEPTLYVVPDPDIDEGDW